MDFKEIKLRDSILSFEDLREVYDVLVEGAFDDKGNFNPLLFELTKNLVFLNVFCGVQFDEGDDISAFALSIDPNEILYNSRRKEQSDQETINALDQQWFYVTENAREAVEDITRFKPQRDAMAALMALINVAKDKLDTVDMKALAKQVTQFTPDNVGKAYVDNVLSIDKHRKK